jgi:transposase
LTAVEGHRVRERPCGDRPYAHVLLVGLPAVTVLGVEDTAASVVVHVELRTVKAGCPSCGVVAWVKDGPPSSSSTCRPSAARPGSSGTSTAGVVRTGTARWARFTGEDARIAPARAAMTDRAGRWATEQVGRLGRTVAEAARDLGCDWHTVNDAVMAYGAALVDDDPKRIGLVEALGLDETLFCRRGRWRTRQWCTSIVDVGPGQVHLLDVVPGRSAAAPSTWLEARPEAWRTAIRFGVLDLSGLYRKTFEDALGHVTQVADPFHLVKLANPKLDECRRRVQDEALGHRGRKDDPLYRAGAC